MAAEIVDITPDLPKDPHERELFIARARIAVREHNRQLHDLLFPQDD